MTTPMPYRALKRAMIGEVETAMPTPRPAKHVPVRITKVVVPRAGYCIGETPNGDAVFIPASLQQQGELFPSSRGEIIPMGVVSNETSRSDIPLRAVYLLDGSGQKIATAREDAAAPTPRNQTMVTLPAIPVVVAREVIRALDDAPDADTAARLLPIVQIIRHALAGS